MHILQTIASIIAGAAFAIGSFFSPAPAQPAGAALPAATAVFETSLAAPISSTATSLTLVDNTVRGGGTLSGYACFTIDEGSSQAEYVCGTVSGTSVTSLTRGLSPTTGTTTTSALQFAHRRGASVKITDFPLIQILKAQANGQDTFPNILHYTSHPTFTGTTDIIDKAYVDAIAFSGAAVIDATTLARGVVELATGAEAAASTQNGSSGVLALPAMLATSTFNSGSAANVIPVTGLNGRIDNAFISPYASTTLAASSTALLNLHGLGYAFPSSQSTSTVLTNDGTGNLTWKAGGQYFQSSAGWNVTSTATTSALVVALTPNTVSPSSNLKVTAFYVEATAGTNCFPALDIGNGSATTTLIYTGAFGGFSTALMQSVIVATSTTAENEFTTLFNQPAAVPTATAQFEYATTSPFRNDQTLYLDFRNHSSTGTACVLGSVDIRTE